MKPLSLMDFVHLKHHRELRPPLRVMEHADSVFSPCISACSPLSAELWLWAGWCDSE